LDKAGANTLLTEKFGALDKALATPERHLPDNKKEPRVKMPGTEARPVGVCVNTKVDAAKNLVDECGTAPIVTKYVKKGATDGFTLT